MPRPASDETWDRHLAGVHDLCTRRPSQWQPGNTPNNCRYAGHVERLHSHSYSGPLICGCDDFAS